MSTSRCFFFLLCVCVASSIQAQTQCNWQPQAGQIVTDCANPKIGVGTATPVRDLHVKNTAGSAVVIVQGTATGDTGIRLIGDGDWKFGPNVGGAGSGTLSFYDMIGAANRFVITPGKGIYAMGPGQNTFNPDLITTPSANGGTLFIQDTAGLSRSGGMVAFGTGLGYFAAIKGALWDGSTNPLGDLVLATRRVHTDAQLTRSMLLDHYGQVGIGMDFPAAQFDVKGTSAQRILTRITGYSNWLGAEFEDMTIDGFATDGVRLAMRGNSQITVSNLAIGDRTIPVISSAGSSPLYLNRAGSAGQNVVIGEAGRNVGLRVEGTGDSWFAGNVTVGGNIGAKYQDLAEWVPTTAALSPGTVVVLDDTRPNHVRASTEPYDTTVAGVVSARPGVILGEPGDSKAMIATTGRVRVRVDASRHPISIGDLLVTSDKPGVAMKSVPVDVQGVKFHRPGTLVGKALEPLDGGEGEVLVLLSLQ